MAETLKNIPISSIDFGERFRKDYGDLKELGEKIKKRGLIHPIAVQEAGDRYILLAGGRRFSACKLIGMENIDAKVFPADLTELDRRDIELSENIDRQDLKPQERWLLEAKIHKLRQEQKGNLPARSGGPATVAGKPAPAGQSISDTARELGQAQATTSLHIKLGNLMQESPEIASLLKSCSTDKEARQLLAKITTGINKAQQLQDIKSKGVDKVHEGLINSYVIGDAFEGIEAEPDESFDFVEIDPPYAMDLKHMKKHDGVTNTQLSDYNEIAVVDYPDFMERLLTLTFQKQKNNTWLILWFAIHHYQMILTVLREVGYNVWRVPGVWIKPTGQTNQPERILASCYEPFFYARKGSAVIQKQGSLNTLKYTGVTTIGDKAKIHPTERPIEMIGHLIEVFMEPKSDQRVLTPFAGSGNTILAAANFGHTCIGFDLVDNYKVDYSHRVLGSRPPMYKSY